LNDLSGEISLIKQAESVASQYGTGAFEVVGEDGNYGFSARTDEEGITEVDIDFAFEEGGQHFCEIGGSFAQLHDEDFAFVEGNGFLIEQVVCAVGIAYQHAGDGGFRAFVDAKAEDHDGMLIEEFDDFHEGSYAVVEKDRELLDEGRMEFFRG